MKIEQKVVTPEMARDWLNMNTKNRRVRDNTLGVLVTSIKRGEWKLTHQPIAFDRDGLLLDGQHRLMACVMSGKSLPMMIATDCERGTFDAIDIGARRSIADILTLPPLEAATLRFITTLAFTNKDVTPQLCERVLPYVGKLVHQVVAECPKRRRYVTTSAVFAAAVIRILGGENPQYVLNILRPLTMLETDDLPMVAKAYIRRIFDSTGKGGAAMNMQFANAWVMFNSDNEDKDRFRADPETARLEARGTIYAVLGLQIPEIDATPTKKAGR